MTNYPVKCPECGATSGINLACPSEVYLTFADYRDNSSGRDFEEVVTPEDGYAWPLSTKTHCDECGHVGAYAAFAVDAEGNRKHPNVITNYRAIKLVTNTGWVKYLDDMGVPQEVDNLEHFIWLLEEGRCFIKN